MREVGSGVRVVARLVVNPVRRANRWWDEHRALTDLVFLAFVGWLVLEYWFRWWLVLVLPIGATALVVWGAAVARVVGRPGRG
ncbi:hypothetical protein [Streptomyces flavofungini]|uniref:hypothetical protein n=1 Tax=Streptomyces flavofungini TaxID=68200 RepID=UPI0025AFA159|nr:hypothetical protein [Streptomyces flavofungini]WJV50003.1 hypothetical protein QUY26_33485 [Streptomyces flavofungini]